MKNKNHYRFQNREISWLSFNYRVLQEAKDKNVPLYERIKFLAIFSSNLDEFFRVRVASHRSLLSLKKKSRKELKFDPEELLNEIHEIVLKQQTEFGEIYRNEIIPELKNYGIFLVNENELDDNQKEYIEYYFRKNAVRYIQPALLQKKMITPFLKNKSLYLALKLKAKNKPTAGKEEKIKYKYALVEIPSDKIPRFIELPGTNDKKFVIFLDDLIRFNLPKIFKGYDIVESYSVKLTRDAELYLGDEFNGNLLSKIKESLNKRDTGVPSRFLYDLAMDDAFLKYLRKAIGLSKEDPVQGGRYHNFNDFFGFPGPGNPELYYKPIPQLNYKPFSADADKFAAIASKDHMIQFPYQSYKHVLDFFDAAATDPKVKSIKVTQYRVATHSSIVDSLINAAKNGKDVVVFVELKARFDEESNIRCGEDMEKAGVKVFYSFPGLKVHAKIALVTRIENGTEKLYSYLSTGNFNENNAKIYTDLGFFTSDVRITGELEKVFDYLQRKEIENDFEHLLVAQFNIRKKLGALIKNEMRNAAEGKEARIILKLNAIEDRKMIKQLYEASAAGVKIDIICRGICCLVPGIEGMSENIRVLSIVDRYLEHGRLYYFLNGGEEILYAASADWMKRNLSRRIEVAFPIYNPDIKKELKDTLTLQLKDNTKARIIDENNNNFFFSFGEKKTHSQLDIYELLKKHS